MYKHILIPTDGSPLSTAAIEKGLDFAGQLGARATVLLVIEPLQAFTLNPAGLEVAYAEYDRRSNEAANDILAQAKEEGAKRGVEVEALKATSSDPSTTIVETADKQGNDLIIMASHGRSGFKAFVLGSVTSRVLASSKIPVLVYR